MDPPRTDPTRSPQAIRFGDFVADLDERTLTGPRGQISLQEQPFRLLELLLERPGELIPREEVQRALWPDGTNVDFDRGINTAVNKLRLALGDSADSPRFIETVPRRGYRFLAPTQPEPRQAPSDEAQPPHAQPVAGSHRNRTIALAAIVVAVLCASLLWMGPWGSSTGDVPQVRATLAILPFENLSGDPGQDFFAVGLTEEMTSRLGRLAPGELGVIARTTMRAYAQQQRTVSAIAQDLGADYVLEGSVRRFGDRVRVTAQLIRAADQTSIWSDDHDSRIRDILRIQREVAERVAQSLAVEVLPESERSTEVDPRAYEAYLRGLHFRDMLTEDGYQRAIGLFEQAIELDPSFAPAYAAMSTCYCLLAGHGLEVAAPATLMPRTRHFAERALELDKGLSTARGALGMAHFKHEWDWGRAERALRRATETNPSDPMGRIWYSFYLTSRARHDEAAIEVDAAVRSDPLSRVANVNRAWQRYEARLYDEAEAYFSDALELFPGLWVAYWGRGLARLHNGAHAAALEDLDRAVDASNGNSSVLGALAIAHARSGDEEAARAVLATLEERSHDQYVPSVVFVGIYAELGDRDRAFAAAERGADERSRSMAWIRVSHEFDLLRDDARFEALLRRMDLLGGASFDR
jgi:TolB-like protein/DNA-binding winged helix-turn-helix (wHTH) protein